MGVFLYNTMGIGWDGNENTAMEMEGNRIKKLFPAHL